MHACKFLPHSLHLWGKSKRWGIWCCPGVLLLCNQMSGLFCNHCNNSTNMFKKISGYVCRYWFRSIVIHSKHPLLLFLKRQKCWLVLQLSINEPTTVWVIRCLTFIEILREISDHLCICLVCNEDESNRRFYFLLSILFIFSILDQDQTILVYNKQ